VTVYTISSSWNNASILNFTNFSGSNVNIALVNSRGPNWEF